jgi:hypothetical protein
MRVNRGVGSSFLLGPSCSGLVEGGSGVGPSEVEKGELDHICINISYLVYGLLLRK